MRLRGFYRQHAIDTTESVQYAGYRCIRWTYASSTLPFQNDWLRVGDDNGSPRAYSVSTIRGYGVCLTRKHGNLADMAYVIFRFVVGVGQRHRFLLFLSGDTELERSWTGTATPLHSCGTFRALSSSGNTRRDIRSANIVDHGPHRGGPGAISVEHKSGRLESD